MLNTHSFYPSIAFLSGPGGVMREVAMENVWRNINGELLHESDVRTIFFGDQAARPGARPTHGNRYYDRASPVPEDASAINVDGVFLLKKTRHCRLCLAATYLHSHVAS